MKRFIILSVFCFIGVLFAQSASNELIKYTLFIPPNVYNESFVIYEGNHDIVDIHIPLNAINFAAIDNNHETHTDENFLTDLTVFFVEADTNEGTREYQGLYVYKNGSAKNILTTGRTTASSANNNNLVFFGASDGLYVYDVNSNSAVKYGSVTDGIISIATDEKGQTIYILTDDHKLYKVTNNGQSKELVQDVIDAREIVLDDSNNMYYYTSDRELFIHSADEISKVEGIPKECTLIKLVRSPFVIKHTIGLVCDTSVFFVYSNGTVGEFELVFSSETKPIAYVLEAALMRYYAINKKLYEYNLRIINRFPLFKKIKERAQNVKATTENTEN